VEKSPVIRRAGIIVVLVAAGLAVWFGDAAGQRLKQKPDLDAGERIYKQNCINCHGLSGKGDGAAAEKLDPKPTDLTSPATQAKKDAELLEVIKFGRPGTAMPGWMSEIDEREMRDVLAYIRTLSGQ
jgi:mono/diheme cytochrome c family protein